MSTALSLPPDRDPVLLYKGAALAQPCQNRSFSSVQGVVSHGSYEVRAVISIQTKYIKGMEETTHDFK